MAKLTIQLNGTAGSVNTPDAKASRILDLYIEARYSENPIRQPGNFDIPAAVPLADLTPAQRINWAAADLARYMAEVARSRRKALARQAADEAAREEVATLDWRA